VSPHVREVHESRGVRTQIALRDGGAEVVCITKVVTIERQSVGTRVVVHRKVLAAASEVRKVAERVATGVADFNVVISTVTLVFGMVGGLRGFGTIAPAWGKWGKTTSKPVAIPLLMLAREMVRRTGVSGRIAAS
jgi:hypothetical protein